MQCTNPTYKFESDLLENMTPINWYANAPNLEEWCSILCVVINVAVLRYIPRGNIHAFGEAEFLAMIALSEHGAIIARNVVDNIPCEYL